MEFFFSTGVYSHRQRLYAQLFSNTSVYTPQVIINGTLEMLGSDENKIAKAIANATGETPSVAFAIKSNEIAGDKIAIQFSAAGNTSNNYIFALLVQNKASTKIKVGENDGAMLTSYNEVRSLVSSSVKKDGTCILPISLNVSLKDESLVLFIQNAHSLKITGAVKKML